MLNECVCVYVCYVVLVRRVGQGPERKRGSCQAKRSGEAGQCDPVTDRVLSQAALQKASQEGWWKNRMFSDVFVLPVLCHLYSCGLHFVFLQWCFLWNPEFTLKGFSHLAFQTLPEDIKESITNIIKFMLQREYVKV